MKTIKYKDFSFEKHMRVIAQNRFAKAQLELTYGCNLHCLHCYTDPLNRPELIKKELSFEEVTSALDKFSEEGVLWLCLTGGEIFMRRDFLDIYRYAFQKGFILTLFTNGTLITKDVINCFKEFPPFSVEISILGATAETFDKITQVPGSFKKCLEGIKTLLENKIPLRLKTSMMKENKHELSEIKELVESFGLEFKSDSIIYPRLDGDTSSLDHRLSAKEVLDLEFKIGAYKDELSLINRESCNQADESEEANPNHYRCGCGTDKFHMDPYGMVGACTWQRKNRYNFQETNLTANMQELGGKITSEVYTSESACRDCQAHAFCEKMPEMAPYESGHIEKPIDYFCDIAFGRKEKLKENLH